MPNLNVVYEDNHIIVVEKPVNVPSQADKTNDIDMLKIIKQYLKEKYNKPRRSIFRSSTQVRQTCWWCYGICQNI